MSFGAPSQAQAFVHAPRLVFYTSCFQGSNLTAAVQPLAVIEISAADWRRFGESELYRKGGQITAIQTKKRGAGSLSA